MYEGSDFSAAVRICEESDFSKANIDYEWSNFTGRYKLYIMINTKRYKMKAKKTNKERRKEQRGKRRKKRNKTRK
jgi:hypothetical protein